MDPISGTVEAVPVKYFDYLFKEEVSSIQQG